MTLHGGAMYNPFDVIRRNADWTLGFAVLPDGERGRWYERHKVMVLDSGLGRVARRCTATHEVVHAENGDETCESAVLQARQEASVDRDASRRLIDIHDLADIAAAHPDDAHLVADELDVDLETLRCRLRHLHPSERHYLRQRMEHTEGIA
jgi:hypothetical protein